MPTVTDPANELCHLFQHLKTHEQVNNQHTHAALAKIFGAEDSPTELFAILAIVFRRVDRLKKLIAALPDWDKDRQNRAVQSLRALENVLAPDRFHTEWTNNVKGISANGNLQALDFMSPSVQRLAKYKIPTSEERKALVQQLDEQIATFSEHEAISGDALLNSLKVLRTVLLKLEFFGVEYLAEKIDAANLTAWHTEKSDQRITGNHDKSRYQSLRSTLFNIVTAIIFVHEGYQAAVWLAENAISVTALVEQGINTSLQLAPPQTLPPTPDETAFPGSRTAEAGTDVVSSG